MIVVNKVLEMRQASPYQAESVYIYGKLWMESLESGDAVDVTTMRHQNFEQNMKVFRSGHDSLLYDVNEFIAIWESVIAA